MADLFGKGLLGPIRPSIKGMLKTRFLAPPFSVLSARDGDWQARKRAWIRLGIESEIGRDENLLRFSSSCTTGFTADINGRPKRPANLNNTSIFDPVLCELLYRWFCPPTGQVLDPFAGGSVRGIVAAVLGRSYWGCDLRKEQILANQQQASIIIPSNPPTWRTGDAVKLIPTAPTADFVLSCPPYGDLEKYSDDPADLSNMPAQDFFRAYWAIIEACAGKLKNNRFACFVVGDYRSKETGHYRNLPGLTIRGFQKAGLELPNEAILVTSVGSLPIRINKQFVGARRLGRTHQNVLVFVKGCPKKAAGKIPLETDVQT